MTYQNGLSGKVETQASIRGREALGPDFLTFDDVEERLVEAMQLWARTPGGGHNPFATDAPWQLLTRRARAEAGNVKGMDLLRLLQEDDESETSYWQGRERPSPLTRDDVARRDQASEWLAIVPDRDRQLVITALAAKAVGSGKVKWEAIWKAGGKGKPGPEGLQMRYRRAISTVCQHLNSAENRKGVESSKVLNNPQNKGC